MSGRTKSSHAGDRPTGTAAKFARRNARMAEDYRAGLTLAQIGERYSVTRERVRQILARLGEPVREPKDLPSVIRRVARRERVRELHADGKTTGEMARELGCTQGTICSDLKDLGLAGHRRNARTARTQQAIDLAISGKTLKEIADTLGYKNHAALRSKLAALGFKPRPDRRGAAYVQRKLRKSGGLEELRSLTQSIERAVRRIRGLIDCPDLKP